MDNDPSEEEDDSDDSSTATEARDDHTATAYEAFMANPLQRITTANDLFNANPFEKIVKETDKFLRAASRLKQTKKLHGRPCLNDVTQDDIVSCQAFIQRAHDVGRGFNFRDKTFRDCVCVKNLMDDDIWDGAIFLVSLANQDKALRETQLKGLMEAANQSHATTVLLRRKLWRTRTALHLNTSQERVFLDYQLPFGTKPAVCRHFFQLLFCLKPDTKWKSLRDSLKKSGPGPRKHGLIKHGLIGNNNNPGIGPCEPDLREFFEVMVIDHGEERATRLVQAKTKTGLRNSEADLVELPSAMTKRGMYQRFCYNRGYKIKTDAFGVYPKLEDYPIRTDFNNVFWPLGSKPLQVCSWPSFLAYWKANYPNMIIRKPWEDVCGECTIYHNRWTYGARAEEDSEEEQDEAKEGNAQEQNDEDDDELAPPAMFEQEKLIADDDELAPPAMFEQEKLIADATLHVEQAMAMREMA
jgi:hypothetical protein